LAIWPLVDGGYGIIIHSLTPHLGIGPKNNMVTNSNSQKRVDGG